MAFPDDPALREAILALLGATWTRLPEAIARARGWGADWCELSTPFVEVVEGEVAAHVGVMPVELVVEGEARRLAGIHAVCTAARQRGRGLMRAALERALAWAEVEGGFDGAILWANDPAIYGRFGFVARPESIFVGAVKGGPRRAEELSLARAEDVARVRACLERRAAISRRSGVTGPAALCLIDLALWQPGPSLAYLPEQGAVVVYAVRERFLDLYDVIAPREVTLAEIAAQMGERIDTAVVYFSPERLDAPHLRAEPTTLYDTLMTRGVAMAEVLAVPPLGRC